jgi:uncharacterized protein YdeI (YjbR/CyaY-like superfamily)
MSASPSFDDLAETLAYVPASPLPSTVLLPVELAARLHANAEARRAFEAASDRDRRGYCRYVAEAGHVESRDRRAALVVLMLGS